ncbi:MAG: N-acetylmuramoyl-L-alanine amidase [Clostridiales bacterium]|nr:N-acetylmuramoyl-L-alanine amidase [Clostridiales bacterium]
MSKIKIAVDAGHGSDTAGHRTPPMPSNIDFEKDGIIDVKKGSSIKEHIASVGVCVRLEEELKRNGFEVVKSGWNDAKATDDKDVALKTRQAAIKKAGCKYSVSVHFNAYGDGSSFNSAEGVATYIHSNPSRVGNSKKLAEYVQKNLAKGTKQKNRGVKTAELAMCNCSSLGTKASILVELAFMTNLHEATNLMGNADFWQECAEEICKGFCEMEGKTYIAKTKNDKPKTIYRVQIGAYSKLENAQKQLDKAKDAGFKDAFIKEDK